MNELMLGKLAAQLLLPPGCIIVLAVIGLLSLRRWWGRPLLVASLAALWLLSTTAVSDALLAPLEDAAPPLVGERMAHLLEGPGVPTAIVLLGGGTREKAPEYGGADDLPYAAMLRTIYAAELAQKTGFPVIASGGRVLNTAEASEGEIMRRRLEQFGVPADDVFAEQAAQNTWQNAEQVKKLLADRGIERIVLVTSAWHMPRSQWCFAQHGLQVVPAPADYHGLQRPLDARGYFPDAGALADSSLALHEYLGLAWYRLRYGVSWRPHWPWS